MEFKDFDFGWKLWNPPQETSLPTHRGLGFLGQFLCFPEEIVEPGSQDIGFLHQDFLGAPQAGNVDPLEVNIQRVEPGECLLFIELWLRGFGRVFDELSQAGVGDEIGRDVVRSHRFEAIEFSLSFVQVALRSGKFGEDFGALLVEKKPFRSGGCGFGRGDRVGFR